MVNVDHHHLVELLQPHDIPLSKWEVISMEFIVGFPFTSQKHDAILVVVDKLTKIIHFILVIETYEIIDVVREFILRLIVFMGFPRRSSQIEILSLHPAFGQVCNRN